MGYPLFSVEYSGTNIDTNLTDSIIINTRMGLKTTAGQAEFQIQNIGSPAGYLNKFTINDSVLFYMGYNNVGSALVFSGFVNEISVQDDTKQRNIKISCVDKTERLLSHLDSKAYTSGTGLSNQTASEILSQGTDSIISRINGNIQNDEPDITVNNVQATTKVITPYGYNFRPAFEILREFATDDFTGMGQFIYFIDENYDLHFKPRPGILSTTPTIHEYNFTSFRATYGVFDVINAVYVNCGKDTAGDTVIAVGYNWGSITDIGFRFKYILKAEIADSYRNLSVSEQRDKMRDEGEGWAINYTKLLGEPRWKITADMKGNYYYPGTTTQMIVGEVVKVTSPSNWSGNKLLRIMDIKQSFTTAGWMTTLQLEEDDKTKVEA